MARTKTALSPRKQPRQARAKASVDVILDAAAQVFARHGYAAGTTNRIAERAGLSIGSVYEYFPNKDAILVALARRHLEEGVRVAAALLRDDGDDLLARIIGAMLALHEQNPKLHRVLFEETPLPKVLRTEIADGEARLVAAVAARLADRGLADAELKAYFAVHLIESMTHRFVLWPPKTHGRDAFVRELTAMLGPYLT